MKLEQQKKLGPLSGIRSSVWIWVTLGVGLLAAGQFLILTNRLAPGAAVSVAGLLCMALGWLLPPGFLNLTREFFVQLKKSATAPSVPARGAKAPANSAVGKFSGLSWKLALGRWSALPFIPEEFRFSRLWLLGIAALMLLIASVLGLRGSLMPAILAIALGLLPFFIYMQDPARELRVTGGPRLAKLALLLLLGCIPQIFSVNLLWGYRWVLTGAAITALAAAFQIWAVKRYAVFSELTPGETDTEGYWDRVKGNPWVKLGLVAAAAGLGYAAQNVLPQRDYFTAVVAGFGAIGLLLLSFPWLPGSVPSWTFLPAPLRSLLGLGLAVTAFSIGAVAQRRMGIGQVEASLWLYALGGVLLVLALPLRSAIEARAAKDEGTAVAVPTDLNAFERRAEWLLFGGMFLLSLWLRAWRVNIFPWAAEGDEAGGGIWALWALYGQVDNPLIHQNLPLTFLSVTSLFFKFFGVSVGVMRIHAVIFGTLSVLSFYFFCRLLWGRMPALLASLVMAFSYWHLHFSRFGHYNIEQAFAEMVALYFFLRAERLGRFRDAILGGFALALAMQPHLAGRLLPFQFIVYFIFLMIYKRRVLAARWAHYTVFVLAAWLLLAPALVFWLRTPALSMGRAKSVSIFDRTNTNAPRDAVVGFVANSKISILMFNWMGDSRHRDNPLAPQQMIEYWGSILIALGFCFVIYHWRDPVHCFLMAALFINLAASVFSVEAPQSLRTVGNIPVVFAFVAVMYRAFFDLLRGLGRRLGATVAVAVLIPLTIFLCAKSFNKYFVEARNLAFDVLPTLVSEQAGKRSGQNYVAKFWATGFVQSHPPVELFKLDTPLGSHADLMEALPVRENVDKNYLFMLCDNYMAAMPYLQWLYPGAKQELLSDIRPDYKGQPLVQILDVPSDLIKKSLGCRLLGYAAQGAQGTGQELGYKSVAMEPTERAAYRSFSWEGTVWIPAYGHWKLWGSTLGKASVWIDGKPYSSTQAGKYQSQEKDLAAGMHRIRVIYDPPADRERFFLNWSGRPIRTGYVYNLRSNMHGEIPSTYFMRFDKQHGMSATFYLSDNWDGDIAVKAIQPQLLFHYLDPPIPGKWSALWQGDLRVDMPGIYSFQTQASGFSEVEIDGKVVFRGGSPMRPVLNPTPVVVAQLSHGWHRLKVRFVTQGSLNLDFGWSGPDSGGKHEYVPAERLRPLL